MPLAGSKPALCKLYQLLICCQNNLSGNRCDDLLYQ